MSLANCRESFALPSVLLSTYLLVFPPTYMQGAELSHKMNPESRTAHAFEEVRKDRLAVRAFLYQMPKGGDLHVHLIGAVYAEPLIRTAGEDGLCVDATKLAFVKAGGATCAPGTTPAISLPTNRKLYDALVDAFSMRAFAPVAGESGHGHFFDTFDKFADVDARHTSEWIDEVAASGYAE
jgi:adenosine deaminase